MVPKKIGFSFIPEISNYFPQIPQINADRFYSSQEISVSLRDQWEIIIPDLTNPIEV